MCCVALWKLKKKNPTSILLVNVKPKQIWNVLKTNFKLFIVRIYFSESEQILVLLVMETVSVEIKV